MGKQTLLGAIAVAIGLLLAAALLVAAEWGARTFTDISFGGNSKNLFTANRFGPSSGNTPGVLAYSFGIPVFLDSSGFRVPSMDYKYPADAARSLLLIGDSVTFGVGVEEPETFAGRLRSKESKWRVYNAAVIGHAASDYLNTVRALLDKGYAFSNVVLVFCLNDVSKKSAAEIDRAVKTPPAANEPQAQTPPAAPNTQPPENVHWVDTLRRLEIFARANDFFRERSKLYLLFKGLLSNPSHRYFLHDFQNYLDKKAVLQQLAPIEAIAAELASRSIDFLVIIAPYEYQLRAGGSGMIDGHDIRLPQQLISEFLVERNIRHFDAASATNAGKSGTRYFLTFDPMHLSPTGHAAIFSLIQQHVVDARH